MSIDNSDAYAMQLASAELNRTRAELAVTRQALADLVKAAMTARDYGGSSALVWRSLDERLAAARVVLGEDTTA